MPRSYKFYVLVALSCLVLAINCANIINQGSEDGKREIHDHKLSNEDHYVDKDNDKKFEHNVDYDHDAFLGKDEADKFKALSPEESKKRLAELVDKIDIDHDGSVIEKELQEWLKNITKKVILKEASVNWNDLVQNKTVDEYVNINYGSLSQCFHSIYQIFKNETFKIKSEIVNKIDKNHDKFVNEKELRNWIRYQHKLYLQKSAEKRWKEINSNKDEHLTFDELIDNTIGGQENWSEEEKEKRKDDFKVYLKLMERDKKRFKAADFDGDGKLSLKEYADFLHPEETNTMRDIVIDETMEDLDKNSDGVVNIEEFIDDMYKGAHIDKTGVEPDWIKNEKEQFKTIRDKNNDNVLDREEIANWILPADYDHTLNEAKHLIFEADENKDGKLDKEEILKNFNLFVASQATAYGQAIYEREDL